MELIRVQALVVAWGSVTQDFKGCGMARTDVICTSREVLDQ